MLLWMCFSPCGCCVSLALLLNTDIQTTAISRGPTASVSQTHKNYHVREVCLYRWTVVCVHYLKQGHWGLSNTLTLKQGVRSSALKPCSSSTTQRGARYRPPSFLSVTEWFTRKEQSVLLCWGRRFNSPGMFGALKRNRKSLSSWRQFVDSHTHTHMNTHAGSNQSHITYRKHKSDVCSL